MRYPTITLITSLFLGLSACGGSSPPEPITGNWTFTIHPAGEPATHASAAIVETVYLEEKDGVVSGHKAPFSFTGTRNGDQLNLAVLIPESSGPAEHSQMSLSLSDDSHAQGSGSTPLPLDPYTPNGSSLSTNAQNVVSYDVTAHRVAAMESIPAKATTLKATATAMASTAAQVPLTMTQVTANQPIPRMASALSLRDVCDAVSDIASFAVGKLTASMFKPMGGCWGQWDGGGYYAFGRNAPGSLLPFWTSNVYQPIEWVWYGSRDYGFTFSYTGETTIKKGLDLVVDGFKATLQTILPQYDMSELTSQVDHLKSTYGNFALLVVIHPRTGFKGLYVINESNSSAIENEPIVRDIANFFGASVLSGRVIKDKFNLYRMAVPVGDQLIFQYLFGTANVNLN